MINCLYIKITNSKRGMPVRSYRTLTTEEVSIGRGAECNIHLLDPRISMHHAVIKRMDDGQLHLIAINGELEVDGAIQQNIVLTHGTKVMIGSFQLAVAPAPPDVDIAIEMVLAQQLPDDFQNIKSKIHEPLIGAAGFKRKLAMAMVAFISLIFLVMPLAQNLIPSLHASMAKLPLGFDRVWSPGHISNSHLHFGSQCFNCHEVLTQQVTDEACMKCHRSVAPHIANPTLQKQVFDQTKLFTNRISCAECHREHKSPYPLARQDNTTCVKCHGNIKAVDADTKLSNIHDFDRDHPAFKLTFVTGDKEKKVERIPQSDKARLVEKSGLKFPHSQHFGKVQGPNGIWDVRELSCTNCHRQEGLEMRFKPVEYKRDCALCHANQLNVGPADGLINVPHGSAQNVINTLKVQAPNQSAKYLASLGSDGCAYCHDIKRTKTTSKTESKTSTKIKSEQDSVLPWHVAPLNINQDWFSKAHFNHASHRTQQCQLCHQVEESETSADVAMPNRQACLRCHSGNSPKPKRIASSCMSCHIFHDSHMGNKPPQEENK
jgi:predicted CXXCH cytochrome family protein